MAKIDLLRQLIREEVIKALRQELPKIISENTKAENGVKNVIREMKKSEIPLTLNTIDTYKKKNNSRSFASSAPLNDLLKETANSMASDDVDNYSFTTDNVNPISFFQPKEATVGDASKFRCIDGANQ